MNDFYTITDPQTLFVCMYCFLHENDGKTVDLLHDVVLVGSEGTIIKKGKRHMIRVFIHENCPHKKFCDENEWETHLLDKR